jgi:hypothetical protein
MAGNWWTHEGRAGPTGRGQVVGRRRVRRSCYGLGRNGCWETEEFSKSMVIGAVYGGMELVEHEKGFVRNRIVVWRDGYS